jgi:AcrR family transcriptional regulator
MLPSKQIRRQTHRVAAPRATASTREKLVEAAGHVFAEHGYQATTVREIVKRSGANIAAVNYHFGDKLGLYTEVLQQSVRAARVDAINSALDQNAPLAGCGKTRLEADAVPRNSLVSTAQPDKKEVCAEKTNSSWMSSAMLARSSECRTTILCVRCAP